MILTFKKTTLIFIVATLVLSFASCSRTFTDMQPILLKQRFGIYRIDAVNYPADGTPARKVVPASTPFPDITPMELHAALGNLFYKRTSFWGDTVDRVFFEKELADLIPYLYRTLKSLPVDQRAVLISRFDPDNSVLSRMQRVTALIWSDKDGLNIVLGEIKEPIPNNDIINADTAWRSIYPINMNRSLRDLSLVSSSDFKFKKVDGHVHETWAVFDPKTIKNIQYVSDEQIKRKQLESEGLESGSIAPPSNTDSLDKLRELKKMKDEGLISEKEYESKRQEILKNFK